MRKCKWGATCLNYESGADISEVVLRGSLNLADFGWDVQHVPYSKKEGFTMRQEIVINHYAWFHESRPSGFWLRS